MAKVKESILYVDDNKTNLLLFREVFKQLYDIDTAVLPSEGLEKIRQKNYHVLLVDYVMPEMTGLEFIKKAKKSFPHTLFIVITAYPDFDNMLPALNMGNVFQFIYKPWNTVEMAATLEFAFISYYERENNRILIKELIKQNEILVTEKNKLEDENNSLKKDIDYLAEKNG